MENLKIRVLTLEEARKIIVQSCHLPELKKKIDELREKLNSESTKESLNPIKMVADELGAFRSHLNPDAVASLHKETIVQIFCEKELANGFFHDGFADAVAIDIGDEDAVFAVCYFRDGTSTSFNKTNIHP